MADFLTPSQRSERMARIRGRDTAPELLFRKKLHALGFRYSLHSRALPGRPDLVLRRYNAVVFVHGCFWHRHPGCPIATNPKSNVDFWKEKFERNKERDRRNISQLRRAGWRVFVVWECRVSSTRKADATARKIAGMLRRH